MSKTYVDNRVKYTQSILTVPALKKHRAILLVFKDTENIYSGYHWTIGEVKYFIMEYFQTWAKLDGTDYDGDPVVGLERCYGFEMGI